jgi:hypothetical protein
LPGAVGIREHQQVEEFDLARGAQGTHKPRNGVDDQTKAGLTLLERRLVALALNRNRREMRRLACRHATLGNSAGRNMDPAGGMHNVYLAVRETNVAHLIQTGRHLGQKGNIPDSRSA